MRRLTPGWIWPFAAIGFLVASLPLIGLLLNLSRSHWWALITSPSAFIALRLSVVTAAIATVACVVLGVPLGLVFAFVRSRLVSATRAIVFIPLVLPPLVAGLALLVTFGRTGFIGAPLYRLGIMIPFSTFAVIVAHIYVSLPFVVFTVEQSTRGVHHAPLDLAAGFGGTRSRILWKIILPGIRGGIVTGTILAFARSLGEFGATLMFAGSLQGVTRTLPLEIYLRNEDNPQAAMALSVILMLIALLTIIVTYTRRRSP